MISVFLRVFSAVGVGVTTATLTDTDPKPATGILKLRSEPADAIRHQRVVLLLPYATWPGLHGHLGQINKFPTFQFPYLQNGDMTESISSAISKIRVLIFEKHLKQCQAPMCKPIC